MEPATILTTFNPAEAQLVRSRLDAADIPVAVIHETSALSMEGYAMAVGGIRVEVPADCAQAARDLLAADATVPTDAPDER
jgi:hypothetical protein